MLIVNPTNLEAVRSRIVTTVVLFDLWCGVETAYKAMSSKPRAAWKAREATTRTYHGRAVHNGALAATRHDDSHGRQGTTWQMP